MNVYVAQGDFDKEYSEVIAASHDLNQLVEMIKTRAMDITEHKRGDGRLKMTQYSFKYDEIRITVWNDGEEALVCGLEAREDYPKTIAKYPFSEEPFEFPITVELIKSRLEAVERDEE